MRRADALTSPDGVTWTGDRGMRRDVLPSDRDAVGGCLPAASTEQRRV